MINITERKTFKASHLTLKILAYAVWIIGGIMLIRKASELLVEANALNPTSLWVWLAVAIGILLGSLKAKYLFNKSCKKNIARIDALEEPKLWQFYRPKFFLFLSLMIATGVTLSRMAHGSFPFLLSVAALDISIETALIRRSIVFWKEKAFSK